MRDGTAQTDRDMAPGRVMGIAALGDGFGDAEIALTVRHLGELDIDLAGIEKRRIDIPAWASA